MLTRTPPPFAISGSNSSVSRGTVVFSNSNNVSFGMNGSTITASASGGNTGFISAGAATASLGTVVFSNSNGLSFGVNGQTVTGSHNGLISQSNQSAIKAFGASNTGNTAGNTGLSTGIDWVLAGTNNITVSESTTAGGPNTLWLSGANTNAQLSAGVSTGGNTSGDTGVFTGRLVLAGGNNITLSGSSNGGSYTVSISAPNLGAGAMSAGASSLGNTAGSTGITGTQLVLVGTGVVSLSQSTGANGGTLSISVPNTSSLSATGWASIATNANTISIGASTTAQFYAVGNTFGTTSGTGGIDSQSIRGSGGVSVAASNSGWVISADPCYTLSQFEILGDLNPQAMVTNATLGQNSLYFVPFDILMPLSAYRLNAFISLATTVTAANSTGRGGFTLSAALYSRQTGASTDRIGLHWSGTAGVAMTMTSNTQLVITNLAGISNSTQVSTVGTSLSTSNATTYPANSMGGFRVIPFPISSTLTPGRYWFAMANSTSSANAGACLLNASIMQMSMSNFIDFRPFGTSSAASNASFYPYIDGAGTYSVTSGAFPATIPLTSDTIRAAVTMIVPYANFSAFTTGINWL